MLKYNIKIYIFDYIKLFYNFNKIFKNKNKNILINKLNNYYLIYLKKTFKFNNLINKIKFENERKKKYLIYILYFYINKNYTYFDFCSKEFLDFFKKCKLLSNKFSIKKINIYLILYILFLNYIIKYNLSTYIIYILNKFYFFYILKKNRINYIKNYLYIYKKNFKIKNSKNLNKLIESSIKNSFYNFKFPFITKKIFLITFFENLKIFKFLLYKNLKWFLLKSKIIIYIYKEYKLLFNKIYLNNFYIKFLIKKYLNLNYIYNLNNKYFYYIIRKILIKNILKINLYKLILNEIINIYNFI